MKVIIHAPSAAALRRARLEASHLVASPVEGTVRIVASGDGATTAISDRDPDSDHLTILCGDTLAHHALVAPPGMEVTPNGTELIAKLQRKGWTYIRA